MLLRRFSLSKRKVLPLLSRLAEFILKVKLLVYHQFQVLKHTQRVAVRKYDADPLDLWVGK